MQSTPRLKKSSFLKKGQLPIAKFEVYHDSAWVNLCDIDDENYLEDFSVSLGGAKMLPTPIAGEWSAVINNQDGMFHPQHPDSSYSDLFEEGKRIRISLGATFETYRDDFDAVDIGDEWTTHNTDAARTIVQAGGILTIHIDGSTDAVWSGSKNKAPKLYQDAPTPPFEFVAKVSAFVAAGSTSCGIFIGHYDCVWKEGKAAYKFLKKNPIGVGHHIEVDRQDPDEQEPGSDEYTGLNESGELWFKITVDASEDVRFYVSDDGSDWFQMEYDGSPHVWSGFFLSDMQIGIVAGATSHVGSIDAPFEYVELVKSDGLDHYWQRIIGYMEEPSYQGRAHTVNISGYDYMKRLIDTELRKTENYWGDTETTSTVASEETLGSELYDEGDAMEIDTEVNNVTNWSTVDDAEIHSIADAGGGTTWVGRVIKTSDGSAISGYAENNDVGAVEQDKTYKVVFKYARAITGAMTVGIYKTGTTELMGEITGLSSDSWVEEIFYFKATESTDMRMRITVKGASKVGTSFKIDVISIKEVSTVFYNHSYPLGATCTGVYYVTIDDLPIYYRDEGQGWYYDSTTQRLHFEDEKLIEDGTDNLDILFFTAQTLENVVADLLVDAGLYDDQEAALAGMDYTATGITVDKVFFEAGTTCLEAVRLCCERANYRFFFQYDGTPDFNPAPTADVVGSEDIALNESNYSEPSYYREKDELWNRVVIEGLKQAQLIAPEEAMESELRGEENDSTSIAAYGEHTKTINNHLFQDQTEIDAMCVTLLALRKDPNYYFAFTLDFNALPLEIGDTVRQQALLATGTGKKWGQFTWGDGTVWGGGRVVVVQRGLIRDISISKFDVQYKCEEVT